MNGYLDSVFNMLSVIDDIRERRSVSGNEKETHLRRILTHAQQILAEHGLGKPINLYFFSSNEIISTKEPKTFPETGIPIAYGGSKENPTILYLLKNIRLLHVSGTYYHHHYREEWTTEWTGKARELTLESPEVLSAFDYILNLLEYRLCTMITASIREELVKTKGEKLKEKIAILMKVIAKAGALEKSRVVNTLKEIGNSKVLDPILEAALNFQTEEKLIKETLKLEAYPQSLVSSYDLQELQVPGRFDVKILNAIGDALQSLGSERLIQAAMSSEKERKKAIFHLMMRYWPSGRLAEVIDQLGDIGDDEAVDVLIWSFEYYRDHAFKYKLASDIFQKIVSALGRANNRHASQFLSKVYKHSEDQRLRKMIGDALGKNRPHSLWEKLRR